MLACGLLYLSHKVNQREAESMSKYRLICPECNAVVITTYPEAAVWELCPACKRHMWDLHDVRMADKMDVEPSIGPRRSTYAEN